MAWYGLLDDWLHYYTDYIVSYWYTTCAELLALLGRLALDTLLHCCTASIIVLNCIVNCK